MEEASLQDAILAGYSAAQKQGLWFMPSRPKLMFDLSSPQKKADTIILATGQTDYELIDIPIRRLPRAQIEPESTADELWKCVKEHYGITAATAFLSVGQIPIPKPWLGHVVMKGSSYFTNPISEFGLRFYPGKLLRYGSTAARSSKTVFGTVRVFGLIGRANIVGFLGFAIFDVISLAVCMNKDKESD